MNKYNFDSMKLLKIKNPFITISFIFLEKYFLGCYNQHRRIDEDKLKIKEYSKENNPDWQTELKKLFLDIHFYLICWANIKKILRKLERTIKDKDFKKIHGEYNGHLDTFIEFRTYLEHLVENLENEKKKKLLKKPGDLGNLEGDFFTFGGKKLYIGKKNLEILNSLYSDLNKWLENIKIVEEFNKNG